MQSAVEHRGQVRNATRVRQNVAPAAIGAAFLLYFGFLHLAEPTGTDLFGRANLVFYHTLRIGGLAMAAVALWCVVGRPTALAVDAVVSVLIGGSLILTGLGMAVDGGEMVQTVINVVCGGMFVSSGLHNWKDYQVLSAIAASGAPVHGRPRTAVVAQASEAPTPGNVPSLASNLLRRTLSPTSPDAAREAAPQPSVKHVCPPSPSPVEGRGEGREHRETATPSEPPPEGFLAALSKKTPPLDADEQGSRP